MTATRPVPTLRGEERLYFEHAARRELIFQTCAACGHRQWYPRVVCTSCGDPGVDVTVAAGRGRIHSFTTLYRAGHVSRAADVPYTIVLVDLDEGVRVFSELVDCSPADVRVDMPVRVDFREVVDGLTLPVFVKEDDGAR